MLICYSFTVYGLLCVKNSDVGMVPFNTHFIAHRGSIMSEMWFCSSDYVFFMIRMLDDLC